MDGFAGWIGVESTTAHDGQARAELAAGQDHLNPAGTVHGGVLATLVDAAMGAAVRSTIGGDDVPATSQLTIAYLRPGQQGGSWPLPGCASRASICSCARPTSSRTSTR